jgi:hypothetical protein
MYSLKCLEHNTSTFPKVKPFNPRVLKKMAKAYSLEEQTIYEDVKNIIISRLGFELQLLQMYV